MSQLAYLTRGNASPQGKPRVYFCCHPADQAAFLQPMARELLAQADCSIWYDPADETELLIELLFFGPVIHVLGPKDFLAKIKERIIRQRKLLQETE